MNPNEQINTEPDSMHPVSTHNEDVNPEYINPDVQLEKSRAETMQPEHDNQESESESSGTENDSRQSNIDAVNGETVAVSDRAKWLREEAFKKKQLAESRDRASIRAIAKDQVSNRALWLQRAFKKNETEKQVDKLKKEDKPKIENMEQVIEKKENLDSQDRSYSSEESKSMSFGNESNSDEMSEDISVGSDGQVKFLRESMKNIPPDHVSHKAKWLQDAFKKEDKQQDSPSASKETVKEPKAKITIVADKFGGPKKPNKINMDERFAGMAKVKSTVQKKKEEFERQMKEEKEKHDPKANIKTTWKTKGAAYGLYKKKTVDKRGVAPKKDLSQLP